MKRYAELIEIINYKNHKIKNLWDNKIVRKCFV